MNSTHLVESRSNAEHGDEDFNASDEAIVVPEQVDNDAEAAPAWVCPATGDMRRMAEIWRHRIRESCDVPKFF